MRVNGSDTPVIHDDLTINDWLGCLAKARRPNLVHLVPGSNDSGTANSTENAGNLVELNP